MEAQYIGMLVLFGLSALLPGIGLLGVWKSSHAEQEAYRRIPPADDGSGDMTHVHHELFVKLNHQRMLGASAYAGRDFLLIGGGLLAGTVASVWAVLDTASM